MAVLSVPARLLLRSQGIEEIRGIAGRGSFRLGLTQFSAQQEFIPRRFGPIAGFVACLKLRQRLACRPKKILAPKGHAAVQKLKLLPVGTTERRSHPWRHGHALIGYRGSGHDDVLPGLQGDGGVEG